MISWFSANFFAHPVLIFAAALVLAIILISFIIAAIEVETDTIVAEWPGIVGKRLSKKGAKNDSAD